MFNSDERNLVPMKLFILFFTLCFSQFLFAQDISSSVAQKSRILKLVYKDIDNSPYMSAAPNNTGLYSELMTLVANSIGFELEVIRVPKKRTYYMLEQGVADLYASGEFHAYRSEFLYYFPNSLYRHEVYYGVSHDGIPDINSLAEVKNNKLEWLVELGSSWYLQAKKFTINYREVADATIEAAVEMLHHDRPFFFQIKKEDIDDFERNSKVSLASLGIKVHKNCCDIRDAPLYSSFSRSSPWYEEELNPDYDANLPKSVFNFPTKPKKNSVAWRFSQAMKTLIEEGVVEKLKLKYGA